MDVKNSLLNRYLNVEIIEDVNDVNDMDGVNEKGDHVEVIKDIGNDVNNMDDVILKDNRNLIIIQSYVDDIMFRGRSSKMLYDFILPMQAEFEMSMVGELTYFICFQVKQMKDGIFFYQSIYARNIMKKYGLENCRHKYTPTTTHAKLSKDEQGVTVDQSLYKIMIGSLLCLSVICPKNTFYWCVCSLLRKS